MASRLLLATLAFAAAAPVAAAQRPAPATTPVPALAARLPVDSQVRIGTLANGVRYYIRQNTRPEQRAELRLVIDAGSIQEDDDQLGLAHFVEHMAFNGTRNFARNELVSYLESIGVRFGADLNASTGFDETIYILPIPTDTARIVEQGFQILEDWAHGLLFDPEEVKKEIGVVVEEWRGRRGASERMLRQWLPVALKDSRYAERLPIGTRESIEGATPETLRRFYRDWYRPDLMAVIAVGDFDPVRIEALIRRHFSGIEGPAAPRARPVADVPDNREPLVAIATDEEAGSSSVNVIFKLPRLETHTVADYRRDVLERLHIGMLNGRLDEIAQRPDAPFLGAGASKGSFIARTRTAFTLVAGVRDGEIAEGLEALLTEARRVERFGFLPSELEREKQDLLRAYERAYDERDRTPSSAFVSEYVGHFLLGEPIPGIEYEYRIVQQLLPTITVEEVNALARGWITEENRLVIAQAPLKEVVAVPTEVQLLAAFDRAGEAPIAAWTEELSEAPLVAALPPAGTIVGERVIPGTDVTEWRLSNGARVLFKSTDFRADEVLFSAYSPGGSSLASDAEHMSASQAAQVVALSGLGEFNRVDLGKKLAGRAASVAANIGATSEGLSGRASPRDLETLFELAHLHFTAPRLDTAAFQAFRTQVLQYVANRGNVPQQVFVDTIVVTLTRHHVRSRPLTAETFAEVDPERALAFYRERFADAGDFTFLFVGNISAEALRPLVERYLASLPAAGRSETWRDVGGAPPTGIVERAVRKGSEPQASTLLIFTGPFRYAPENRFALRTLTDLVQIKLTETLREQLGGTYSPNVGGAGSRAPREEYAIQVQFGSSPENVEPLTRTVLALIDTLKMQGPSVADVEKVKEQLLREREVSLKQNAYWLGNIAARDQAGEPLAGLLEPYDAMVRALTPAQIQAAARQYFDTGNYARFVLLPEG